MAEYSYYLLGTQRLNVGANDSVVGVATEDLSNTKQYLLVDSTGDCTFFLQYSTDSGVTWTDYPSSEGWSIDNSAKIFEFNLSGLIRGLVRNNSSSTVNDVQMTLWTESDAYYCTATEAYAQAFPGIDTSSIASGIPTVSETIDFIQDAMAEIDQETQTAFVPTTISEVQDGNGTQITYPRKWPLISVSSLTINDDAMTEDTDFVLYPTAKEGALIAIKQGAGSMFYVGQRNIEFTYTYGYATTPRLARTLCAQIAALKMLTSQVGGTYDDVTGGSVGSFQFTKGEPSANIQKTIQTLDGLVGKPGQIQLNTERLKKYVGYRAISYRPRWGWID